MGPVVAVAVGGSGGAAAAGAAAVAYAVERGAASFGWLHERWESRQVSYEDVVVDVQLEHKVSAAILGKDSRGSAEGERVVDRTLSSHGNLAEEMGLMIANLTTAHETLAENGSDSWCVPLPFRYSIFLCQASIVNKSTQCQVT